MKLLTIGKLAECIGISTDTLRYYEKMKLIKAESRSKAGYRLYSPDTVDIIRFIRGAKALNFTLEEIRKLLAINTSDRATCAEVLKHTEGKIAEAETKIGELKEIKRVLTRLVSCCPGDNTSVKSCPIIDHIRKAKPLVIGMAIASMTLIPQPAKAKPISYVGGTMIMQENDETGHSIATDYTFDPHYAVGWVSRWEENEKGDKDYSIHSPEFNTLIHRWNMPDGQANIYNATGIGVAEGQGKSSAAAWTDFLADYETRRVFSSYEIRLSDAGSIGHYVWQRARVGVAPYKADYDDIATWFMLQVDDHPSKNQPFVATPLVRFFYKTTLVEVGYSSNHHLMFNWWLQF